MINQWKNYACGNDSSARNAGIVQLSELQDLANDIRYLVVASQNNAEFSKHNASDK
jgi:hypothetical protein